MAEKKGKGPWRYRLATFVRHYDGSRLLKGGGDVVVLNVPPDKVGKGYTLVEDEPVVPTKVKPVEPEFKKDTLSGRQTRPASRPLGG